MGLSGRRRRADGPAGDPTVFGTLPVNQRAVEAVAGVATSTQGNGYSHSSGMEECRQAVADHHSTPLSRVPAHHVFMTSGCSQALEVRRPVCAPPRRENERPPLSRPASRADLLRRTWHCRRHSTATGARAHFVPR